MAHRGNLSEQERALVETPEVFLAGNVVIVRSPIAAKRINAQYWSLIPADTGNFETSTGDVAALKNRKGASVPCFNLRQDDNGAIHAYYLHWQEDDVLQLNLGGDADFFITATMNGCSLSYSTVGGTVVAHHNDKQGSGRATEIESQQIQNKANATYFHQADYRKSRGIIRKSIDSQYFATVVGFRDGNVWRFVSASRKLYSGTSNWSHKGVKVIN